MKTDNLNTYTWDPNWGNPASVNSTNLIYDAFGQMVEQQNGSTYTQILYSPAGKTAIMSGQTLSKAFVKLPGGGTAMYNSSSSSPVYYRHTDWLGSARLTSTASRTVYSDSAYSPYGEQYALDGTADASFTGQNSDTTSTLYDFLYREFSPTQGRWISPDPAGLSAVDPTNPQTWNRYAYVMNSPLAFIDPFGLKCVPGALNYENDCQVPNYPPPPGCEWTTNAEDDEWTGMSCTFPSPPQPNACPSSAPCGSQAANNGTPKQTKQQCIDNFLKTGYGPAGNFMAKTMVPSFSAVSIFTNTWSWAKGEGATLLAKGALSAGPMAYGKILTTTGTNMAAYPGTAAAGADIAETGAFWTTTGATAGEALLFVGVEGSVFATTADLYARWTCRNVP